MAATVDTFLNELLRRLCREKLQGADLIEPRMLRTDRQEWKVAVAWRRPKAAGQPGDGDWTYGTHVALVARDRDEAMLVWGHYDIASEQDALNDLKGR